MTGRPHVEDPGAQSEIARLEGRILDLERAVINLTSMVISLSRNVHHTADIDEWNEALGKVMEWVQLIHITSHLEGL